MRYDSYSLRNEAISMSRSGGLVLFLTLVMCSLPILAQGSNPTPATPSHFQNSLRQSRIAGAIDDSLLTTLPGNTHPLARPEFDLGQAPVSMPANRLVLVLARSRQQEADLQTYLQSVQDSNSPNYRNFLSPDQFGQRFGVGDSDLAAIQGWLASQGFAVSKLAKGRMAIEFSGSVGQVQSAFHTSIHSFLVNGEQHWANAADPQIPTALAPVVSGLASLSNFKPKAQSIRGPSGIYNAQDHTITPSYTTGSAANGYYMFLGPADAATIYNTPTVLNANLSGTAYDGTGVTIGIAGDSNINLTQNANYRATFGLAPKATTVVVDGADPGENSDALEAYLDTEVAGGIAPNASIILYTASDTTYEPGLFLAIQRALDDNQVDILNVSFGECEAGQGAAGNQQIMNMWEQAAAQGITVTVSSGDSGSAGCDNENTQQVAYQGLAVNGLGSTPYNISVGGTDFDVLYSNFPTSFSSYVDLSNTLPNHRSARKYIPEEPWNDSTYPNSSIAQNKPMSSYSGNQSDNDIVAGGGGISTVYPVPVWQSSFASGSGRNLPDVAFLAGDGFYGAAWGLCTDMDSIGVDCVAGATGNSFNLTGVGGTSAAAPAFAGMLALVKQKTGTRLGQADYALYDMAKSSYSIVFNDVTSGDNSVNCQASTGGCTANTAGYYFMTGYNATAGYDRASGLGSVIATHMVSNWPSASFTATSSSLQLNGATSALNITHGQSVTVATSVTSSGGTPTGEVALVDSLSPALLPNDESIADFTLNSGNASGTTSSLPGGTYNVSAHYGGSATFAASDSNAIPVTVGPENSSTSLLVAGYYDPATGRAAATPNYGFIYLVDAQPYGNSASASSPNGAATGTITFKSGGTTLGTAPLASNGIAELQTSLLPGGLDSLSASFPGDASFQADTSAAYPFTVNRAVTTLSSQLNHSTTPVSLAVTLATDSLGVAPTGTITFMNGSNTVGTAQLTGMAAIGASPASGTAAFSTAGLPGGTYNIVAVYGGDSNYGGSSAPAISVTTGPYTTPLVVTPSSTSIFQNQALQISVTPTAVTGLPLPTGSVSLVPPGLPTRTANLVSGTATFAFAANILPLGGDLFLATYSGDANYAQSSAATGVTVNASGTLKPTVTVNAPTTTVNYPITVGVTVSGPNGSPVPGGTVQLSTTYTANSLLLVNGSTSFTYQANSLTGGPNTVTANYLGDSNYSSGSAKAIVTVIASPIIQFSPSYPTISAAQPLTTSITVTGPAGAGTPTGTVSLSSGTYTSSPAQLTAGTAVVTIPAGTLAAGSDTVIASYSGDSNFIAGTNNEIVTVTAVQPPGLTITGTGVVISGPGTATGDTSTITLTPSGGFTGSIALTAAITASPSGAIDMPTLSFGSTSPVSIAGSTAGTATLTVSTTAPLSTCSAANARPGRFQWFAGGGAALACVLLFGIPARRRRWRPVLGMIALFLAIVSGVTACGGGGGGGQACNTVMTGGTTVGTYTITVTGTSGATTSTAMVNLTVQ